MFITHSTVTIDLSPVLRTQGLGFTEPNSSVFYWLLIEIMNIFKHLSLCTLVAKHGSAWLRIHVLLITIRCIEFHHASLVSQENWIGHRLKINQSLIQSRKAVILQRFLLGPRTVYCWRRTLKVSLSLHSFTFQDFLLAPWKILFGWIGINLCLVWSSQTYRTRKCQSPYLQAFQNSRIKGYGLTGSYTPRQFILSTFTCPTGTWKHVK